MIIDMHTHLGDILYPDGGKLIAQKGVRKKILYDVITQSELLSHRGVTDFLDKWLYDKMFSLVTRASRARNFTATLENTILSMDAAGVDKSACMPIPPHVTFTDLHKASKEEDRVIPFTGVDFTRKYDLESQLRKDVQNGAKGMKLHPIIQRKALASQEVFQAVEAFSIHRLPILFHCGISGYYLGNERQSKQDPALGKIADAAKMAANFPNVTFIAGHAGLFEYREVIAKLSGLRNVMVDTSFQSPEHVRELIDAFGPERVLFASDWPYGNRPPAINIVRKACKGDSQLQERIFHKNAAALLNLE